MKIRIIISIVMMAASLVNAGIETATTTAEGYGETYLEAVDGALISATQQVRGAEISITRIPYKMFASEGEANMVLGMGSVSQSTVMVDSSASIYLKRFQGYVKSYKVTSGAEISAKKWHVTIEAEVYKAKETDKGEIKRDTIAVLQLHTDVGSFDFFGKTLSANNLTNGISSELDVQLSKIDKLDVVDRKYLADIARENATVTSGRDTFKQQVLLGLISGADYIMTGTLRDFRVGDIARGSETLGFVSHKYQAKITVDLRIIAVGSSKIVCADTLDIWLKHSDIIAQRRDTYDFGQLDIKDQQLIISRLLAERICDKTIEAIFPARVAKIVADSVVITGGSANVSVGDRYEIEVGSEVIVDPQTGVELGRVGGSNVTIEIIQVNDKISIGKVSEGNIDNLKTGDICKKLDPQQKKDTKGRAGDIQPGNGGGIRLPGD